MNRVILDRCSRLSPSPPASPPDKIKDAADGLFGAKSLTSLMIVTVDWKGLFGVAGLTPRSYVSRIGCG